VSDRLFANDWHLVAELKFSLLSNAKIARQVNRGEVEYIVQNQLDGQVFRLSEYAYPIVAMLDGKRSVNEIWHAIVQKLGDMVPTQQELISLLSSLYKAGLIRSEAYPNIEVQQEESEKKQRKMLLAKLKFPLAIKVPLYDPDRFLNRTKGITRFVFHPLSIFLYVTLLLVAGLQFWINIESFGQVSADSLLALENVLLMALIYPIVKIIHEFGHAYCVKHWGGEVHEMGVMFLVFFPVPYVDASASAVFPNKYARMLVGAAGILVELGITALAILVWISAEPSIIKALAYNVIVLCGISTLVFNGNPLLRFDAYYVLSDWWEEPNLGKVANSQCAYLAKKYLLKIQTQSGVIRTPWQNTKLVVYAVASYIYRIFVMLLIAVYVASGYFLLGVAVAIMSIYFGFVKPLYTFISSPFKDSELSQYPWRAKGSMFGLILLALIVLFALPLPQSHTVEGIVVAQEDAYIRAPLSGHIEYRLKTAQQVDSGELLVKLEPQALNDLSARLTEQLNVATQQESINILDPIEKEKAYQNRVWKEERLTYINSQIALSEMTSNNSGYWIPETQHALGQYIGQGTTLGYVLKPENMAIVALVAEENIELFDGQSVEVLRTAEGSFYPSTIVYESIQGSRIITYPRLTVDGGGQIAARQDAQERLVSVRPYVTYEIKLPFATNHLHERVQIQFTLQSEPVAYRIYRSVRRTFLSWFGF
jgi:putative peptide zinc metalloprotease protein